MNLAVKMFLDNVPCPAIDRRLARMPAWICPAAGVRRWQARAPTGGTAGR